MSQDAGQGFRIHAAGESMGCEGVPQIVEATQAASQVVCDLCSETERMVFIIGLHAGMQFAWEVTEPTEIKL